MIVVRANLFPSSPSASSTPAKMQSLRIASVALGVIWSAASSPPPAASSAPASPVFLRGSVITAPMTPAKTSDASTPTQAATHSWPVAEMTTPPSSPPPEPPKRMKVPITGCFLENSAGE